MAGNNWGTTRTLGGTRYTQAPQYAAPQTLSPTASAFGPEFTTPTASYGQRVAPTHGFGIALWAGITGIVVLCTIRHFLPN